MMNNVSLPFSGQTAEAICLDVKWTTELIPDYTEEVMGTDGYYHDETNHIVIQFEHEGSKFIKKLEGIYISNGFLSSRSIYKGETIEIIFFEEDPIGTAQRTKQWWRIILELALFLLITFFIGWVIYGYHKLVQEN